jgi:predicted transcriptional regulator
MDETIIECTVEITASFIGRNKVQQADLPTLIRSIHSALAAVGQPAPEPHDEAIVKPTAAQIRKSVTDDALISFIDGKPYKTLKRHLTTHGETLASYKAKYGLPVDYPSTAPSYSAQRSEMARRIGLGNARKGQRKVDQ